MNGKPWIILGKGPSRARLAEFLVKWPESEVVSLNDDRDPKATVHVHAYCREDWGLADLVGLREVVLPYAETQLSNGVPFPAEDIRLKFKSGYLDHATPMAIAYALLCGASCIVLCGCDYGGTKDGIPCTMFWLGIASQHCDPYIPRESSLFMGLMDMRIFGNNLR